jgi:hypothetical protein
MNGQHPTGQAPASPALPGLGAELRTPEDLRDWLAEHGRRDPEAAHDFVDALVLGALRAIQDGHHEPAALARAVLTVTDAYFPRWSA